MLYKNIVISSKNTSIQQGWKAQEGVLKKKKKGTAGGRKWSYSQRVSEPPAWLRASRRFWARPSGRVVAAPVQIRTERAAGTSQHFTSAFP